MSLTGGCSCGRVRYAVAAPLMRARSCHCSKCRKTFSGAGSAYAEVEPGSFSWTEGEDALIAHETAPGWGLLFCGTCGSTICGTHEGRVHGVTLGCVDGDPGVHIEMHIFVGSRAPWDHVGGDAPQYEAEPGSEARRRHLELIALVVSDYDEAIAFFVDVLAFELVEDSPSLTNDGRPKRWVVVRPPGAETGILLARADGERQAEVVGEQFAGRVGLFLRVDDFEAAYERMVAAGVRFLSEPRSEPYGRLAVFEDLEGNRWDLLGPAPAARSQA